MLRSLVPSTQQGSKTVLKSAFLNVRGFAKKPAAVEEKKKKKIYGQTAVWPHAVMKDKLAERYAKLQSDSNKIAPPVDVPVIDGAWNDYWLSVWKQKDLPVQGEGDSLHARVKSTVPRFFFPYKLDFDSEGVQVVATTRTVNKEINNHFNKRWIEFQTRVLVELPASLTAEKQTLPANNPLVGSLLVQREPLPAFPGFETNAKGEVVRVAGESRGVKHSRAQLEQAPRRGYQYTTQDLGVHWVNTPIPADVPVGTTGWVLAGHGKLASRVAARSLGLGNPEAKHPVFADDKMFELVPQGTTHDFQDGKNFDQRNTLFDIESDFVLLDVDMEKGLAVYEVRVVAGSPHALRALRLQFAEAGFPVVNDPFHNSKHVEEALKVSTTLEPSYRRVLAEQKAQQAAQLSGDVPARLRPDLLVKKAAKINVADLTQQQQKAVEAEIKPETPAEAPAAAETTPATPEEQPKEAAPASVPAVSPAEPAAPVEVVLGGKPEAEVKPQEDLSATPLAQTRPAPLRLGNDYQGPDLVTGLRVTGVRLFPPFHNVLAEEPILIELPLKEGFVSTVEEALSRD